MYLIAISCDERSLLLRLVAGESSEEARTLVEVLDRALEASEAEAWAVSEEEFDRPPVKVCATCKTQKPGTAFGRDRHQVDGLNRRCLACCREQGRRRAQPRRASSEAPLAVP